MLTKENDAETDSNSTDYGLRHAKTLVEEHGEEIVTEEDSFEESSESDLMESVLEGSADGPREEQDKVLSLND